MKDYVITIGRQFGSGGRVLGRMLAERLGIPFYDKELLHQAAQSHGISADFFENNDERLPKFINGALSFSLGMNPMPWYSGTSSISDDSLYRAQSDFICQLAEKGPCVIVGRSADYVLRDYPNVVKIFVHANMDDCVRRIVQRSDCLNPAKARQLAERTNKLRANYYNFYTDKRWGDAASYDLTFNSSLLPMEDIVDIVVAYLEKRFK